MTEPTPLRTPDSPGYFPVEDIHSKSTLISRNITILGRRTSVRLEPEMWNALRDISRREGCSMHDICSLINIRKNARTSLTGAIRVFLMLYYRAASTDEGHSRAGHGSFETMKRRAQLSKDMREYYPHHAVQQRGGISDRPQAVFAGSPC